MPRLLIVEDDESISTMLCRWFFSHGYEVEAAFDGQAAVEALNRDAFDLVLLDVMLPKINGIGVLQELRRVWSANELPVILATARTDTDEVVRFLAEGANDHVSKPFDFEVLLARVAVQLRLRDSFLQRIAPPDVSEGDSIGEGTVLQGRYVLKSVAGKGASAVVYDARQVSTGQRVAVKLFHEENVDHVKMARFEREMRLVGQLRHPNIVRLIDCGHLVLPTPKFLSVSDAMRGSSTPPTAQTLHPVPYLVMDFLEGESLKDTLIRRGGLPIHEAVDLMLPIVSALAMAHSMGVIHRDLKPANIFMADGPGESVSPVILDFGLAKQGGDTNVTIPSSFVGTPQYMAPEQAKGSEHIDQRTDQYALALMLYETLTGRSPFEGMTLFQVIHASVFGEFAPPSRAVPGLPRQLALVMERGLHLEPDARFPSIWELGEALLPYASSGIRAQWQDALRPQNTPRLASSLPPPAHRALMRSGSLSLDMSELDEKK